MRRLVVSMVAALVAVSLVPIASAQEEDDQVTLRVGLTQDWEVLNPTSGYTVAALRGVEPPLRHPDRQGGGRFRHHPRSGRILGGGRARARVHLHAAGGPDLVRRRATHRRGRRLEHQHRPRSGLGQHGLDGREHRGDRRSTSAPSDSSLRSPTPSCPPWTSIWCRKHIWEPIATDYDATTQYAADDGVGSGPFVVTEFTPGQSVVMDANPSYWGWEGEEPPYDQVIFRLFENPDAMVAALQQGELDAAQGIPGQLLGRPGGR